MWIMTFISCISLLWFFGVYGQSIELHPYNSSLANTVCGDGVVLLGDWFLMTAILNATGTSRDELPLDRIILHEKRESDIWSCNGVIVVKNTICEINIELDGCGEPVPGKCGYCDFEQDDVYHLVFNITATGHSFKYEKDRAIELTWAGESKTISYPRVLTSEFLLFFPVGMYIELEFSYVNGSVTSQQYTDTQTAPACISPGTSEKVDKITWILPNETIQKDRPCLDKARYDKMITEHPPNIQVRNYDSLCARGDSLISPLFHGYVRDAECELKTDKEWVCTPPTYSLCISLRSSNAIVVFNASDSDWCGLDFVQEINDTTLFATYSGTLRKVVERHALPTFTTSFSLHYEISQYTECTNDTGVFSFTVNESQSPIRPGDNVTFFCEIYGFPLLNAQLLHDVGPAMGQLKSYEAMVYLLNYTLDNLQCEDSGRYVCKVDRGYGATIEARQKFVDVNVVCPPKLNVSEHSGQTPAYTYNPDVGIVIEVYGYPEPTHFVLQVKTDDSAYQEVDTELYSVMTVSLTPPFFRLTLTFEMPNEHGSNTYVLHVSNGEGNGLDIDFNVIWKESSSESPSAWLIIVVIVSCTLIIITVIVLVAMRKALLRRCTNTSGESDESVSYDNVQSRRNNSDFASSGMSTGSENLNTGSTESAGSTSNDHVYSDPSPESDYIDPIPESDYIDPIPEPDYDTEGVCYTMDQDGYIHHEFRY